MNCRQPRCPFWGFGISLEEPEKGEDLVKIFTAVATALGNKGDFDSSSQIATFAQILSGDTDEELENLALVIDGFTFFLLKRNTWSVSLHGKVWEIVGTL